MNIDFKKVVAEVLGTFVLVLIGTGTAVLSGGNMLITAFAFGLAVVMMAYAVGGYSGGHFNPAVTLAMFIKKKLSGMELVTYMVSQVVGALLATLFLFVMLPSSSLGANMVNTTFLGTDGMALVKGLLVEIILTFIFIFTIINVTKDEKNSVIAGLIIGLTLVGIILVGFNLTGLSVNPARSLTPALFVGGDALAQVWIFILGPLVGGALAAVVSNVLDKQ